VVIAQLYVHLGDFGWPVLLSRLSETAVGAAAVIVTVAFIVPLRPQRVLTTAVLQWIRALRTLLDAVLDHIDGGREPLQPLVRRADAAYAALVSTAKALRGSGHTASQITQLLALATATRQYARSLAAWFDLDRLPTVDSPPLRDAAEQLRASLQAFEDRLTTGEQRTYVRSASLLAPVLDELRHRPSPLADALRDLTLLDGALAGLATALRMDVTDHDTQ
jgi:uncharacterized membrane protein YccC